jgi:hypothetical protein
MFIQPYLDTVSEGVDVPGGGAHEDGVEHCLNYVIINN